MTNFRLQEAAHIAYAHLQISDLKRSLHFYEDLVGLRRKRTHGRRVALAASPEGTPPLLLTEFPGARPKPPRTTGLYHIAIRYPTRRELARAFKRLYDDGSEFQGFSDHLVSEAIYLADPDGNGVELYVDRPREAWVSRAGQIEMATEALDMDNLLGELDEDESASKEADPKTDMGHVHLHVSDLQKAERLYHTTLGFDITQRSYPGALFMSAGGYHHHIGVNTWAGRDASAPPAGSAGLLSVGIKVPTRETTDVLKKRLDEHQIPYDIQTLDIIQKEVLRVKDPDGTTLEFLSDGAK